MGLDSFECPLRGEKKLLLEKENLDLVLKPILKPCICSKSENMNIENKDVTCHKFLNF